MKQVTYWHWQFGSSVLAPQYLTSYDRFAIGVRTLAPAGVQPAVMVKAHSGTSWQSAFDAHPLAISGPDSLRQLVAAAQAAGVVVGVWGECRGDAYESGRVAGAAAAIAGYYALDLEPYADFGYAYAPAAPTGAICDQAIDFWRGYRAADGPDDVGVSLAPQASGVEPFGRAGLLCWLATVKWLHLQCYGATASTLAPDVSIPYVELRLDAIGLVPHIIEITEPESLGARLAATPEGGFLDVWRI